jgi:hypothetical protein
VDVLEARVEELEGEGAGDVTDVTNVLDSGKDRYTVTSTEPACRHTRDVTGDLSPGLWYTVFVAQTVLVPELLCTMSLMQYQQSSQTYQMKLLPRRSTITLVLLQDTCTLQVASVIAPHAA